MNAFQPPRDFARRLATAGLAVALIAIGATAAPAAGPAPAASPDLCASVTAPPAGGVMQAPVSDAQWWLASIALMVGIALRRTSA